MLKKENPKSRMRMKLGNTMLDRGVSMNTQLQISRTFRNMTDEQKEERASQILTIVNSCKTESEMLTKLSEAQMLEM